MVYLELFEAEAILRALPSGCPEGWEGKGIQSVDDLQSEMVSQRNTIQQNLGDIRADIDELEDELAELERDESSLDSAIDGLDEAAPSLHALLHEQGLAGHTLDQIIHAVQAARAGAVERGRLQVTLFNEEVEG